MEHSSKEFPFLDILIKNTNGQIITDIYHKPTDTQKYLNFNSHPPKKLYKILFPYSLARRIYIIITDKKARLKEVHTTLSQREYPTTRINHHHHHHVVLPARIFLTLSRHFTPSFIASGRSSGLQPIPSQSCWMYVRGSRPAFVRPYVGVHRSTSLMSSSLLLQQCPACLVRLTWIVFLMGGRWPYSWCFMGCCLQDLFNIAHNILK